jgi:hypothetical protein
LRAKSAPLLRALGAADFFDRPGSALGTGLREAFPGAFGPDALPDALRLFPRLESALPSPDLANSQSRDSNRLEGAVPSKAQAGSRDLGAGPPKGSLSASLSRDEPDEDAPLRPLAGVDAAVVVDQSPREIAFSSQSTAFPSNPVDGSVPVLFPASEPPLTNMVLAPFMA